MISAENNPVNQATTDSDFTVEHYRKLLRVAIKGYRLVDYSDIPWGSRFLLWRHDIDYSLNRALVLAKLEHLEGLKATYFINLHSEFYNVTEASQRNNIREILALGHDLGLHFDPAFYDLTSEHDLDRLIAQEAGCLHELFGAEPAAFSFHNPVAAHLTCESDYYGGLVNCYSRRFKTGVGYCSDSNGYWRFRRLHDVLAEANDPCLQILTHPEWWQDVPMPPRQRIFRSAYGRAAASMRIYDSDLEQHGRLNHAGAAAALQVLKSSQPKQFELCDYLWNQGQFQTLFVELWRLHEAQIDRLCKAHLRKVWRIPASEVNAFFGEDGLPVDGWKLFNALFEQQWTEAMGVDQAEYQRWAKTRNQLIHGRCSADTSELETGCVCLCRILQDLAKWGKRQSMGYDGLVHLGSIGLPRHKTAEDSLSERLDETKEDIEDFPKTKWETFKNQLLEFRQ